MPHWISYIHISHRHPIEFYLFCIFPFTGCTYASHHNHKTQQVSSFSWLLSTSQIKSSSCFFLWIPCILIKSLIFSTSLHFIVADCYLNFVLRLNKKLTEICTLWENCFVWLYMVALCLWNEYFTDMDHPFSYSATVIALLVTL